MDFYAFILFIFALQLVCLIAGAHSSKGMQNQQDYFLAGKGLRFFPLMMTFLATQVGGGLFLGSTEESYRFGWSVLLYPLGQAFGFCLLGIGLGRRLAQLKISTIAQIFELIYRSPFLKKVASSLSIISLFLILVAQITASSKFMASVGFTDPVWFTVLWGIIILYTAMGGLKAVVSTDVIQATFFVAAFALCFGYVAFSTDLPVIATLYGTMTEGSSFAFDSSKLYGWLLMPMLFAVIEQDMGQRCFAAESPRIVSKAALSAATLTLGVCIIPVFFGVLANHLGILVSDNESILMTVIKQTTTPTIAAMVGCAILAAIISTADSLINAISSNLAQDFDLAFLKQDHLRASQILTGAIAVAAIFVSFSFNNIVDLMIQSYELSVSCLFIPIIFSLFKKNGNPVSAFLAIACGAAGFFLFRIVPIEFPREIAAILFSLVGYGAGEFASSFTLKNILRME
jgi:SSS family solute:Na+ symporter